MRRIRLWSSSIKERCDEAIAEDSAARIFQSLLIKGNVFLMVSQRNNLPGEHGKAWQPPALGCLTEINGRQRARVAGVSAPVEHGASRLKHSRDQSQRVLS